jgi:hypothetical protein
MFINQLTPTPSGINNDYYQRPFTSFKEMLQFAKRFLIIESELEHNQYTNVKQYNSP